MVKNAYLWTYSLIQRRTVIHFWIPELNRYTTHHVRKHARVYETKC